jgi:hypothetical protein
VSKAQFLENDFRQGKRGKKKVLQNLTSSFQKKMCVSSWQIGCGNMKANSPENRLVQARAWRHVGLIRPPIEFKSAPVTSKPEAAFLLKHVIAKML